MKNRKYHCEECGIKISRTSKIYEGGRCRKCGNKFKSKRKTKENINSYVPYITKENINYFNSAWLDDSVLTLIDRYYNDKNLDKSKVARDFLVDFLEYNEEENKKFAKQCMFNPLLHLAFQKCLKERTIQTYTISKKYLNLIGIKTLAGYVQLLSSAVEILEQAEEKENFHLILNYCKEKSNDREI